MQRMRFQLPAALATFAFLGLALPATSFAAKTKFPSENPAFTIELPHGWTSEIAKDGNLSSHPRDDSAYNFSILDLNGVTSAKQLKAMLPELAKSAGLKKFKLGGIEETQSDAMQFAEVKGRGESDGIPLVVVVTGFEAQKGRFFALLSVGAENTEKKYAKDYEAIAASIEPLKATAGKESAAAELPIADTTLQWDSKAGSVSVYFQPKGKCTIDFQGNEARFVGREDEANSRMIKPYEVTSLPGGKWRVRILLEEPQDITFRVNETNPDAKNGQTVIAAVGKNDGDPYQRGEDGELEFLRGRQSGPPQ